MTSDIRVDPEDWPTAIADTEGPQLVVAGPGTGKTRFISDRVGHLVNSGLARPDEVLVLTFSRRSASDLRRRIADAIQGSFSEIHCSTFHSFASRLLESKGTEVLGWATMPTLLTGPEQVQLVAELLRTEHAPAWPEQYRGLLQSRTFAVDVTDFLLRARERRLGSDDIRQRLPDHPEWSGLPDFMDRYQEELSRRHRIDYGTLLDTAIAVLDDPGVNSEVATQFTYVLVDEYQDTSPAQAALLEAFHRATPNLTAAGDPYQSIYSFRGAALDNIDRFPTTFLHPDGTPARRFVLTTSKRVPAEILDAALSLTAGADLPGGSGPVVPAPHSGTVEAFVFDQTSAEADWIAGEIERLHLVDRIPYSRIAVLLRTKRHLVTELSRSLSRRSIPHDPPDRRLVDHPAVQIIRDIATIAAFSDPDTTSHDGSIDRAVRRLLLGPLFRLPLAAERELFRERHRSDRDWADLLTSEVPGAEELVATISDAAWATTVTAADGFWHVWDNVTAIGALAVREEMGEFRAAWTAFSQALERQSERDPSISLVHYFTLADSDDFEAQPLLSHRAAHDDRITLTTLHQAKGLEFDVVFIADAADSVFPDLRRGISLLSTRELDPHIGADHGSHLRFRLQEEIRLAYTAMTRASRRVVWTATRAGIDEQERRPSRFMVNAVGLTEIGDLRTPDPYDGPPVSIHDAQSYLRRLAVDPTETLPRRLAAISTVTTHGSPWDASRFAGLRAPGPDTGVIGERFRLSPSQGEAYETCPRRYVLERRLGVGDGSSPYAMYGSLIHKVLELAERRALEAGRDRSELSEAIAILDEVWDVAADFGSTVYNAKWRAKGCKLLERLYDEWPPQSGVPVELERQLELEVEGVAWYGYADRIERRRDGRLAIVDYKTSGTVPTKKAMEESMQLGFYVLAASQDEDLQPLGDVGAGETWYPAGRAKGWTRSLDMTRLDDIAERMASVSRAVSAEAWPATPGDACGTCAVRIICPAQPDGRGAFST